MVPGRVSDCFGGIAVKDNSHSTATKHRPRNLRTLHSQFDKRYYIRSDTGLRLYIRTSSLIVSSNSL